MMFLMIAFLCGCLFIYVAGKYGGINSEIANEKVAMVVISNTAEEKNKTFTDRVFDVLYAISEWSRKQVIRFWNFSLKFSILPESVKNWLRK